MIVYLNGKFVPEDQAVVSVFDRSFRYGDGIFEALLAVRGRMFRWPQHAARLQQAADFLRIRLPVAPHILRQASERLLEENRLSDAVVRVTVSRGSGSRGYAPSGDEQPVVVISAHALPAAAPAVALAVSSHRVPVADRLRHHKTASRLLHVLAASEAREAGADEALLLDTNGHVTEGGTSNVFWIKDGTVCTPPIDAGLLPGITRAAVFEICARLGTPVVEQMIDLPGLMDADAVFITLSTRGVAGVTSINQLAVGSSPVVETLREAYLDLVRTECP